MSNKELTAFDKINNIVQSIRSPFVKFEGRPAWQGGGYTVRVTITTGWDIESWVKGELEPMKTTVVSDFDFSNEEIENLPESVILDRIHMYGEHMVKHEYSELFMYGEERPYDPHK